LPGLGSNRLSVSGEVSGAGRAFSGLGLVPGPSDRIKVTNLRHTSAPQYYVAVQQIQGPE
jgi:hypothetical protein